MTVARGVGLSQQDEQHRPTAPGASPPMPPAPLEPARMPTGFAAPGPATQVVFRCVLEALSRPGRPFDLPAAACAALLPPAGVSLAAAAVALTLLDGGVALWLSPSFEQGLLRAWLSFHNRVTWAAEPREARFVLVRGAEVDAAFWMLLRRDSDHPTQEGTTLIVDVDSVDDGHPLVLSGPGIATAQPLRVDGVDSAVWALRRDEARHGPPRVDMLLCCGATVVGLPRSTHIA